MFSFLQGSIRKIATREITLLTSGGVGYQVFVNAKIAATLVLQQQVEFWIYTHQTSESLALFGFTHEQDLDFFKLLLSVNKVGPKIALEILETPREVLENFLTTGDLAAFARIKGVGQKTAQRIILELKGKLVEQQQGQIPAEVSAALLGLGFSQAELKNNFKKIPSDLKNSEDIIKWFLQNR